MSSGFDFNPAEVSASVEVLDKDAYEFIIGEPKSFMRKNSKDADSYGVMFPLTVAEGPCKGKKVFYNTYQQSEGAQAIAKQFLIAAYGFKRDAAGEQAFNKATFGADWKYNPDNKSVGDGWMAVKGKRVIGNLDVEVDKDNNKRQVFKPGCFSPIGS